MKFVFCMYLHVATDAFWLSTGRLTESQHVNRSIMSPDVIKCFPVYCVTSGNKLLCAPPPTKLMFIRCEATGEIVAVVMVTGKQSLYRAVALTSGWCCRKSSTSLQPTRLGNWSWNRMTRPMISNSIINIAMTDRWHLIIAISIRQYCMHVSRYSVSFWGLRHKHKIRLYLFIYLFDFSVFITLVSSSVTVVKSCL